MTIGYLRVSTNGQHLEKNKADILSFANANDLGRVEWVAEKVSTRVDWLKRDLYGVVERLEAGDRIIVAEMSRLGRSMLEIMTILNTCIGKQISVYAVKGNWRLDDTIQSKILAMAFSIAAEIERDLISQRTKEALKARKAAGVILGRPKGPGKSKLDQHQAQIREWLSLGVSKKRIAANVGCSVANLHVYLKRRGIS